MDAIQNNSTELQAANAALAALAAAGNRFALGQLWEINRGLLHQQFWRWYNRNQDTAQAHGLTLEDMEQEGFLAVQYAAERYCQEKGCFSTYLSVAVKRQISRMIHGDRPRSVIAADGRRVQVSANPLNICSSLDTPLSCEDVEGDTVGDVQDDPTAAAEFQAVEDHVYTVELHAVLEDAMSRLSDREARILRGIFWQGQDPAKIAAAEGVTVRRIKQEENTALRKLGQSVTLRQWAYELFPSQIWHGPLV